MTLSTLSLSADLENQQSAESILKPSARDEQSFAPEVSTDSLSVFEDSTATVPALSLPEQADEAPNDESPASGCPRCGTEAPADAPRCPACGIWRSGNTASLRHGLRSARVAGAELPEQAEVAAGLAAWQEEITRDLGGPDALSRLQRDLVGAYVRASAIGDFLGGRVVARGGLTPRGRTSGAFAAFIAITDRQLRLAQALGLERRIRDVSLSDYLSTRRAGGAS